MPTLSINIVLYPIYYKEMDWAGLFYLPSSPQTVWDWVKLSTALPTVLYSEWKSWIQGPAKEAKEWYLSTNDQYVWRRGIGWYTFSCMIFIGLVVAIRFGIFGCLLGLPLPKTPYQYHMRRSLKLNSSIWALPSEWGDPSSHLHACCPFSPGHFELHCMIPVRASFIPTSRTWERQVQLHAGIAG